MDCFAKVRQATETVSGSFVWFRDRVKFVSIYTHRQGGDIKILSDRHHLFKNNQKTVCFQTALLKATKTIRQKAKVPLNREHSECAVM